MALVGYWMRFIESGCFGKRGKWGAAGMKRVWRSGANAVRRRGEDAAICIDIWGGADSVTPPFAGAATVLRQSALL